MKKLFTFYLSVFFLMCCLASVLVGQETEKRIEIKLEVKVSKVGEPPKILSGARRLVYQLVKFEVIEVLKGKLDSKLIVVDYLIWSADQHFKFSEGDSGRITVYQKKKLSIVTREPGIREEGENVDVFYIPGKLDINSNSTKQPY